MFFSRILIFLIVANALVVGTDLMAQNSRNQKYNLAQSYENSGDYKNASRLYLELYNQNKKDITFYRSLVRTYKYQGRYSELLPIALDQVKVQSNAFNHITLGEMYWRIGQTKEAIEEWDLAKTSFPDKLTYIELGKIQTELQIFDQAIITYRTARKVLNSEIEFSDELSRLYIFTGNYEDGTKEVFRLLSEKRSLALSQGRLYALMIDNEAKIFIDEYVTNIAEKSRNDLLIQELFAWYLRTAGKYDNAFEVYKTLDELKKTEGREVLNFANSSRSDGQYEIAMKAYEYIFEQGRVNKFTASALYGYAQTLELVNYSDQGISKEKVIEIIDKYKDIVEEYPRSTTSADCIFRIAELYKTQLNEYDKAKEYFEIITKQYSQYKIAQTTLIDLGKVYLLTDDAKKAGELFTQATIKTKYTTPEIIKQAEYHLALIQYFEGNIDSALALFKEVIKNSDVEITNDALTRINLLESNKDFPAPLIDYTKADYLFFQKKNNESLELLFKIRKSIEGSNLDQRIALRIAEIYQIIGKPILSIKTLEDLLTNEPKTIYGDQAHLELAKLYLKEKDYLKAENYLTKLLVAYPRSIYINEARDLIKQLRTDQKI